MILYFTDSCRVTRKLHTNTDFNKIRQRLIIIVIFVRDKKELPIGTQAYV